MPKNLIKVPIPYEWYEEVNDDDSYIRIKAPKGTGLTRKQLPNHEFFEEVIDDEECLICYFLFESEIDALHFKLKYF